MDKLLALNVLLQVNAHELIAFPVGVMQTAIRPMAVKLPYYVLQGITLFNAGAPQTMRFTETRVANCNVQPVPQGFTL